jgi:hypothetical protein
VGETVESLSRDATKKFMLHLVLLLSLAPASILFDTAQIHTIHTFVLLLAHVHLHMPGHITRSKPMLLAYSLLVTIMLQVVNFTAMSQVVNFTAMPQVVNSTIKSQCFNFTVIPQFVNFTAMPQFVDFTMY